MLLLIKQLFTLSFYRYFIEYLSLFLQSYLEVYSWARHFPCLNVLGRFSSRLSSKSILFTLGNSFSITTASLSIVKSEDSFMFFIFVKFYHHPIPCKFSLLSRFISSFLSPDSIILITCPLHFFSLLSPNPYCTTCSSTFFERFVCFVKDVSL